MIFHEIKRGGSLEPPLLFLQAMNSLSLECEKKAVNCLCNCLLISTLINRCCTSGIEFTRGKYACFYKITEVLCNLVCAFEINLVAYTLFLIYLPCRCSP